MRLRLANDVDAVTMERLDELPPERVFVYSHDGKLWGCDAVELLLYLSDSTVKNFAGRAFPQTQTVAPQRHAHLCDLERLLDQVLGVLDGLPDDGDRGRSSVAKSCKAFGELIGSAFNPLHMWRHEQKVAAHATDLYELLADQDEGTIHEVIELLDKKRKSGAVEDAASGAEILIRPKRFRSFEKIESAILIQSLACTAEHYSALAATPP